MKFKRKKIRELIQIRKALIGWGKEQKMTENNSNLNGVICHESTNRIVTLSFFSKVTILIRLISVL